MAPVGGRLAVLVCEDNEWVRKAFRMTLSRMGHQATLTATGDEAIAALAENDFDVLITDLDLPGMDGVELTSTVRQRRDRERGHRLPIVAVTGHSGGAEEERLIQAGADAFLAKPFELADLTAALERALAGAR
jgi:two-component system sensor histidine kinase EvgS